MWLVCQSIPDTAMQRFIAYHLDLYDFDVSFQGQPSPPISAHILAQWAFSSCWSRGATRRTSDRRQKANEVIEMKCPHCGKEMKEGYLFTTKDGAFSFAEEVPGVFTNASKAPGFVKITPLKASHRVNMKAELCEACRVGVFRY